MYECSCWVYVLCDTIIHVCLSSTTPCIGNHLFYFYHACSGVRGIFFRGGRQSYFSRFFWNASSHRNFQIPILVGPKQISVVSKSEKAKKQKKKKNTIFLLFFSIFTFSPSLAFPGRSAKDFLVKSIGGGGGGRGAECHHLLHHCTLD